MARLLLSSAQNVTDFLCSSVPSFPVRADQVNARLYFCSFTYICYRYLMLNIFLQVSVIYKPAEFYKELVSSCSRASRRILLVSLYLGTGENEKNLVRFLSDLISSSENLLIQNSLLFRSTFLERDLRFAVLR